MRVKTEWGTRTVSSCPKITFVCFSCQDGSTHQSVQAGKLHQVALINRLLGGARNLVAGSKLL
jgi:hypothetical protein